ncbi:MAG: DUF4337 domain-containing protein [Deltaproteobacteria bacterium]|nr:DUF4337 domain-containing protein [Deltaproteobacteria bacterium]
MDNGNEASGNGDARARSRFNNWIAVSVAIVSAFLGVTKIKDDNIVQAMLLAKSNAVDTWSEYQSKRIKHHVAELGLNSALALRSVTMKDSTELNGQVQSYKKTIGRYDSEEQELRQKARGFEKEYDALNFRDDQFDLSDAALSISLAMLAVAALTCKRWLLYLSWGFAGFGFVMGAAGLLGLPLHPNWLASLLS